MNGQHFPGSRNRLPFATLNDSLHYRRDDYDPPLFSWYRTAHLPGREDQELVGLSCVAMEYR